MNTHIRFAGAVMIALFIAAIAVLAAAEPCHPQACHSWDRYDFYYWYFECYTEHCPECGWEV